MSLITIVNSNRGDQSLIKYFFFDLKMSFICTKKLSLNRNQILERKKSNLAKINVQNLKNIVKGILLFCNNIPNNKPEDPTDILAWKVSIPLMDNKEIYQLNTTPIEKGLINNKKDLTITFVRDIIVEKHFR